MGHQTSHILATSGTHTVDVGNITVDTLLLYPEEGSSGGRVSSCDTVDGEYLHNIDLTGGKSIDLSITTGRSGFVRCRESGG